MAVAGVVCGGQPDSTGRVRARVPGMGRRSAAGGRERRSGPGVTMAHPAGTRDHSNEGGLNMDRTLIDAYESAAARLRAAVVGLTREDLTARPGPGEWSILEVVIHLADSDAIAIDR